jgi:hypothetical protein
MSRRGATSLSAAPAPTASSRPVGPGRARTLRWLADAIALVTAILLAGLVIEAAVMDPGFFRSNPATLVLDFFRTGILPFVVANGAVGWLLARRLPSNPIGWCFATGGLFWGAGAFADEWVQLALRGHVEMGLLARIFAVQTPFDWIIPLPLTVQLPLLLLPGGRLLSRRWRPAVWLLIVAVVIGIIGFCTTPGLIEELDPALNIVNPMGIASLGSLPQALANTGAAMLFVALPAGVVAVVLRFRRSTGIERQQMRWVALGGWCMVIGPLTAIVSGSPDFWNSILGTLGILGVPVCVGVAVLRYRLYDLGRIISRTVSYAVITALLLGVYFGLVTAVTRLVPRSSSLAIAGSTLAAAALFQPLRRRVQALVDRRFNRAPYDAERTVEAFTRNLREKVDLEAVSSDLLAVVHQTMQPAKAGLWLRDGRGVAP